MNPDIDSAHVAGSWLKAVAEAHFDHAGKAAESRFKTGGRQRMQGTLAEVRFDRESGCASASRLPVNLSSAESRNPAVTIILVDDDEMDVIAIRRAFWQLRIANPIVVAGDGIEALDMLRGHNDREKIRPPYLVLLDLAMPRMGGLEFLDELRGDPVLRRTLVWVLTTSAAVRDRESAHDKNVAGYVMKPLPGQSFTQAIGALESYWRTIEFPD